MTNLFIVGNTVYTVHNSISKSELQVDKANPAFPRPAAFWWFGCKGSAKGRTKRQALLSFNSAILAKHSTSSFISKRGVGYNKGVGLVSDRSDVPIPKGSDDDPGERKNGGGIIGRSFSDWWKIFAKPFRGISVFQD